MKQEFKDYINKLGLKTIEINDDCYIFPDQRVIIKTKELSKTDNEIEYDNYEKLIINIDNFGKDKKIKPSINHILKLKIDTRKRTGNEHHMFGVPKSKEQIEKIIIGCQGMNTGPREQGVKDKISNTKINKGLTKLVAHYSRTNRSIINKYGSISQASKKTGDSETKIRKRCRGISINQEDPITWFFVNNDGALVNDNGQLINDQWELI